ncbi:MAG: DUF4331 domain-containing protein [Myxococcota bacterium]|nr:DUF4331 domain-containing protein [Myxococcota bacterium]
MLNRIKLSALAVALSAVATPALASSHREAPFITSMPKVDATDFYMFRSYESGREEYVTILANYYPLQDPGGGPNYFFLDQEALYEIHIDNDGDAVEDLTFQFDFDNDLSQSDNQGLKLEIGTAGATKMVAIPLVNSAPVTEADQAGLNVTQSYTLKVVTGDRRSGTSQTVTRVGGGDFAKPMDRIGDKSFPDYQAYADSHVYEIAIPGCTAPGGSNARVFVGQRSDPFFVNLGQVFDLVNTDLSGATSFNVLGARQQGSATNETGNKNVTTLALEIPRSCLKAADDKPIIGAWTTASLRQGRALNPTPTYELPQREGGPWTQVSRLSHPLVNELVIGLKDKNLFNAASPPGDAALIDYVTHPSFPELLELLFSSAGVMAPNNFPRADLVAVFLTGVEGVNQTAGMTAAGATLPGVPSEMLRLNTAVGTATGANPTARDDQNSLGAAACFVDGALDLTNAGCDPSGYPNGRRPGDDVVDIALRVVMGYLTPDAPNKDLPFTDGILVEAAQSNVSFPYLVSPHKGSP